MTDKEVDVLIDYIVELNDTDCICSTLCEIDFCFCDKHCGEEQTDIDRECVREYARVKSEEQTNECS